MDATFQILTTRTPCGNGEIVVHAYADGEIEAAFLMRDDEVLMRLRPGQLHALHVLVRRMGEVVPHADLLLRESRDTLRRDLRDIRGALKKLRLHLDNIPSAGYRLRSARTSVPTIRIGDVRVDVEGRAITRSGKTEVLGANALGILLALSEHPADASALYRTVWRGEPYDISEVVSARVCDLRNALRRIGSSMTVQPWVLFDRGRRQRVARYVLRLPECDLRAARAMSREDTQIALFPKERLACFAAVGRQPIKRRSVGAIRRARQRSDDYAMVIE